MSFHLGKDAPFEGKTERIKQMSSKYGGLPLFLNLFAQAIFTPVRQHPIKANPAKAGYAKPWVYSHTKSDHDRQAAEDHKTFFRMAYQPLEICSTNARRQMPVRKQ
jgi:hypothetical protein